MPTRRSSKRLAEAVGRLPDANEIGTRQHLHRTRHDARLRRRGDTGAPLASRAVAVRGPGRWLGHLEAHPTTEAATAERSRVSGRTGHRDQHTPARLEEDGAGDELGILALIGLAALAGPLLAAGRRPLVPVVVGELLAGVVIGRSGFGWLDPTEPTVAFLAEIGFAMLMFVAGMHVPLRQPGPASGVRRGGLAAVIAALLAPPAGIAVAWASGTDHAAIYALLLASGSVAILLPAFEEQGLLEDPRALTVMAQVAIADIAAIVLLPLVLEPSRALRAALGGLLVALCVSASTP